MFVGHDPLCSHKCPASKQMFKRFVHLHTQTNHIQEFRIMCALYVLNLFLSVSSTRQDTISHGSPLVTMMALQTGDNEKRMFVG